MSDVIQRLRTDKLENQDSAYKEGFTDGQHWAREAASYSQLERLASWADDENWIDTFYDLSEGAWLATTRLYLEVEGKDTPDGEQSRCDEFWNSVAGVEKAKILTGGYVHGFSEGALDVFSKVEYLL